MEDIVSVQVDNRLRIRKNELPAGIEQSIRQAFTYTNPERGKKRALGLSVRGVPEFVKTWRNEGGFLTLPRGATQRLRKLLSQFDYIPRFVDRRLDPGQVDLRTSQLGNGHVRHRVVLPDGTVGTPYPSQLKATVAMSERENCLLRAPTGSGKTTVALMLIAMLRRPSLVILWSSNLLNQWHDRLQVELGLDPSEIGLIRGGKWDIRPITLAMQQSLWSRKKLTNQFRDYFGLVLIDEVQRAAARTIRDVVDVFPARYRFGISADETRKDRMQFLTYDLFGQVAADIPEDELVRAGKIHDVEVRVVPTDFRADWYVQAEGAERNFNRLLEELGSDKDRNALALSIIRDERDQDNQVLVLTHRREHASWLADTAMIGEGCGLLMGGDDHAVRFEEDRTRLLAREIRVAVGTVQAIGQGLDLPSVSRGVAVTPLAGNRQQFGQVRGRICRAAKGKTDAILYYLWDRHVYEKHLVNLLAWNNHVLVLDPESQKWVDGREWQKLNP